MKKYFAWILCPLILLGMVGCADTKQAVPELLEPVGATITTATVQRDTIYTMKTFEGEIIPYVEELYFPTDGTLDEICVFPGDFVEEGQVLATLDKDSIQDQINRLDDQIYEINTLGKYSDRQTEADIGIAKTELEKLRAEGASQQECSEKEQQIQQLEMQLQQAQELRNMELGYKYSTMNELQESLETAQITAPFAGNIVYIQDIANGTWVQGHTTVMCIADNNILSLKTEYQREITFTIADKLNAQILDKTYDITYRPCNPEVDASATSDESGKLTPSKEKEYSLFTVHAQPGELEAGQFVVVTAIYDYTENVLTLPINTLHKDQSGQYVYKLEDGKQVRCDVTVGVKTGTKFEIIEGLSEGDVVCVND